MHWLGKFHGQMKLGIGQLVSPNPAGNEIRAVTFREGEAAVGEIEDKLLHNLSNEDKSKYISFTVPSGWLDLTLFASRFFPVIEQRLIHLVAYRHGSMLPASRIISSSRSHFFGVACWLDYSLCLDSTLITTSLGKVLVAPLVS